MSKFTDAAATSHTLSVTAMEEASRFGQRTAEVDHLLLALVVNEQVAGQVLRNLGVTIDAARAAVEEQHAEQLASLGVQAGGSAQGPIVFHETGGYEWGEGAIEIIKQSASGANRGDAAAVLRELVIEPSGLVEAILARLGTSPDAVIAKLDEVEQYPGHPSERVRGRDSLTGRGEAFIPASVSEVWRMLADPERIPEWEPSIGSVEPAAAPAVGHMAAARTERSDGKRLRVKPELRRIRVEPAELDTDRLVEWRFTFPDVPHANAKRVRIALEAAAGGTQLRIVLAWERNVNRRPSPVLRWFFGPLQRYAVWMQITQIGAGISRVFR